MSRSVVNTHPYSFSLLSSPHSLSLSSYLHHHQLTAPRPRGLIPWSKPLQSSYVGCGHTARKSVVSRGEAYARWQAAVDACNEGADIWILARTDSLILGWEEAVTRAKKAIEIGVDCIFVEALPSHHAMELLRQELDFPVFANIIEGVRTENMSAVEIGQLGYCVVAYPWTLVAARLKSTREALEAIKGSMTVGKPPTILPYAEVRDGVGFDKYYELGERYKYEGRTTGADGHQWTDLRLKGR